LSNPNEQKPRWVQVARILRARGNKGEVAAELLTDFPARLATIGQVYLAKDNQEPKLISLERFWMDQNHPGQCVFHFAGSATISDAEKFRGLDVLLPFEARVELPAGQYFVTDLIGCIVFENSQKIGLVRDVFFPGEGLPGTPLLQIDSSDGELLIPLAEDICTGINTAARRIDVSLPEGLRGSDTLE
jgi:16S rRNA processing protein RimM